MRFHCDAFGYYLPQLSVGPCECLRQRGFNYKLFAFIVVLYSCQENVHSVARRAEITTSYMRDQRGGVLSSFFNLCVWRVALLIGMSGGGLIDCLIACSPNLERRGGGRGEKEDQERIRGFNAAENGKWTMGQIWQESGEGVALFVTDLREICRRRVRMKKREGGSRRGKKDL